MSNAAPQQRTIARAAEAEGIGVHGGHPVRLRLEPAPPDSAIVFVRADLPGAPELRVAPETVAPDSLNRMTVLRNSQAPEASVGMTEHLLSACYGNGVTNLRIAIDAPECPIFDGSAMKYVQLLHQCGIEKQPRPARQFRLRKPVVLATDRAEIVALPAERTRLTFFAEFRHAGMSDEQVTFEPGADDYNALVAPARTFCFEHEVEKLREAGLIKGGSLDCAIVLKDGKPIQGEYRLQNELARHKLLDLMGDLAVLGGPVLALISARASGHALHYEFVRMLEKELIDG